MATLEIHDDQGRVERVTITTDVPAMFGSSPKCEIVLSGAGVLPFHGRIRWRPKKGCFQVDASPDAGFVQINGRRMTATPFRQGDEIAVGGNRIFLIFEGDSAPAEKARVPAPTSLAPAPAPAPVPASPAIAAPLRRGSWRERVEAISLSGETAVAEPVAPGRSRGLGAPATGAKTSARGKGWARLLSWFTAEGHAPGQERVLSSPLVLGLSATLAVLILVGVALYGIIVQTITDRQYDTAVANLEDGDYRNAILRFDEFLAGNPKDPRVGKARVHRAMANVRQYTATAGASWSLALEAERAMLESVGGEEAFRDSSAELGELVTRTGEMLADRARGAGDAKTLAEAESAVDLHARVVGRAAEALLKKSRLPEALAAARAAVRKEARRREAFAAMDAALSAGSSSGVYAARDALVGDYADQADDRQLLARMTRANDLIRKAVTVDTSGRPGETEPHPDPLGPATTLVLRGSEPRAANGPPDADAPLVFALADGNAYALIGETGAPLWQIPVGLASPFPPQPVAGVPAVLAVDARHEELTRLDQRTGALVWRQALGGAVADPPLVLGNQVIQTTTAGKVLVLDLPTGALRATVDLKTPLGRTPVSDESGRMLHVVAEKDCLFVLARDPLGCVAVEYLGHGVGSIACPPARLGRYLVVAENAGISDSRWRVFLLDEDGARLAATQTVPVVGWTWGTPATSGSVIWASGDLGGLAAYAVGAYGEKDPFRLIARVNPDPHPSGPAYSLARTERELLIGSGRSARFELDPERGKLTATWTLAGAGPALAPPRMAGSKLVLTQQNTEGHGVALWGVEPKSGVVSWRTVLGAPWPSAPVAVARNDDALVALGVDGRALVLAPEALTKGGFVESWLPRPGGFRLPSESFARIEGEGWTAVVPTRNADTLLVRAGSEEYKDVVLPSKLGARPLAWGPDLLVPGVDGRVYLIDPRTGGPRAEPFVPPFDRSRPTRWKSPVALGTEAAAIVDESGVVRRLVRAGEPETRLVVAAETTLGAAVVAEPASTGDALVVATADGRVRALSARDLGPIGAWAIAAPMVLPPSAVAGRCYVADASGVVLALGGDGQRLWSARLGAEKTAVAVVGPPAVRGDVVWFLARDGTLHGRAVADGAPIGIEPLGLLPAGGPTAVGSDLMVPVGLGTLRMLRADAGGTGTHRP